MCDYIELSMKCVNDIYERAKTNPKLTVLSVGSLFCPDFEDWIIVTHKHIISTKKYEVVMLDGVYVKHFIDYLFGKTKALVSNAEPHRVMSYYQQEDCASYASAHLYCDPLPTNDASIALRLIYGKDYILYSEADTPLDALHNILRTKELNAYIESLSEEKFVELLGVLCKDKVGLYNGHIHSIYIYLTDGFNPVEQYLNLLAYMFWFKDSLRKDGRQFRHNLLANSAIVLGTVRGDWEGLQNAKYLYMDKVAQ